MKRVWKNIVCGTGLVLLAGSAVATGMDIFGAQPGYRQEERDWSFGGFDQDDAFFHDPESGFDHEYESRRHYDQHDHGDRYDEDSNRRFFEGDFSLDEDDRSTIHLFQLVRNPGKCNASDDKSVRYYDNDDWPAHAPVGMWLEYGLVNDFMREWCLRKEQLKNGEISEDEYFEWKINWPATSSSVDEKGNDKKNNSFQWRNKATY